jgi:hypothetical protein
LVPVSSLPLTILLSVFAASANDRSYGSFSDIVDTHNTINDMPFPLFAAALLAAPSLPILMVAWNVSPHHSFVDEVMKQQPLLRSHS